MRRKLLTASLGAILVVAHALGDAACVSSSEGIRVAITARSGSAVTTVVTDRGYTITLRRAYVCVGALELLPCGATASRRPFSLRIAQAHGVNTATKLATPVVLDVVSGSTSFALGELAPPANNYCNARVSLLPADGDAVGLSSPDAKGHSLFLEGTWSRPGEAEHPLRVVSSLAADGVTSLGLDLREPKQTTVVVEPRAAGWFNGIDFATETDATIEQTLVTAVASSMVTSVP